MAHPLYRKGLQRPKIEKKIVFYEESAATWWPIFELIRHFKKFRPEIGPTVTLKQSQIEAYFKLSIHLKKIWPETGSFSTLKLGFLVLKKALPTVGHFWK